MPTYEYECEECGIRFERRQAITEAPITECPHCQGRVHRLISGGAGFILRESYHDRIGSGGVGCSLEQTGRTCCGRVERCGEPRCEAES